jgi:hypothetical protein
VKLLAKGRWLLFLCGACEAVSAILYFKHAERGFHSTISLHLVAWLALAAGAAAIAAAIWPYRRDAFLIVLHGASLFALGLLLSGAFGSRVSLRAIASLVALAAASASLIAFRAALRLGRESRVSRAQVARLVALAALIFAISFVVLASGVFRSAPGSNPEMIWLGIYFAFSAVATLALTSPRSSPYLPPSAPIRASVTAGSAPQSMGATRTGA